MQNTSDMIELWMDEWQSLLRLGFFSSSHCRLIIPDQLVSNAAFHVIVVSDFF